MKDLASVAADRLELLHTFVRIVEAGSLSAAAERLGTSQPTVSRRLQVLERSLGVRLIQRSTHGMKITEDGERCFSAAQDLLANWQALEADLKGAKDTPRGVLRVLAPHAFGQDQLIAPLAKFLCQHTAVSVEWLLHDRRPDFIAEGIDCAIQVGVVEDPALVAIRLAEVPRIVVAAPSLLKGHELPKHAADLADLPWLALRTYYREEVTLAQNSGESFRFAIRPRLSTDSLYAIRNAALAGVGAAVVSTWVVKDDLAQGRLMQLTPDWQAAALPVHLVYPYARFYPARLRVFVELMRAEMPHLVGMQAPAQAAVLTAR